MGIGRPLHCTVSIRELAVASCWGLAHGKLAGVDDTYIALSPFWSWLWPWGLAHGKLAASGLANLYIAQAAIWQQALAR